MIDKQLAKRFWAKVKRGPKCWEWTGTKGSRGYGHFRCHDRMSMAHRVAYELSHGPIAPGYLILHRCDNPICTRPSHLKPGTFNQNGADAMLKGRSAKGERNGNAKLTEKQVRAIHAALSTGVMVKDLCAAHEIDPKTIWRIRRGISWRHVPAV